MKRLMILSVLFLLALGCSETQSLTEKDPGQITKDTGNKDTVRDTDTVTDTASDIVSDTGNKDTPQTKDDGTVTQDRIVAEDVTADIPQSVITVSGRVWGYEKAMQTYTYSPVGNIDISTHSLVQDLSVTTNDKDCDDWWDKETFECGSFIFKNIPKGSKEFYMEAKGKEGYPACLSQNFSADSDIYTFLVLVHESLIKAVSTLWNIPWNADRGLVIGLIVEGINPQTSPPITGFVGDAVVDIKPLPDNKDFQVVYLDSSDTSKKDRTSTDPAQSMFFLINVDPTQSDTYTVTIKHKTYTFPATAFHVEAGKITYLLIVRNPGD